MKYILSILFIVCCFKITVGQKTRDFELATLRTQIDTAKTLDFKNALEITRKGYALSRIAKSQNDIAFFAAALGNIFHFKSEMDSSLHYHFIALKIYEKQKNVLQQGVVLNKIARVHRKLKNNIKALTYYDLLLKLEIEAENQEGIAVALNESGVVYEQLGDYEEAQNRYRRSLDIQKARGDSTGIGYALAFIGYNYLLQSNWKESEKYLLESLNYFKKTNDYFAMCYNYSYLGQLYSKTKQVEKSNEFINKSTKIARKINYPDIEIENTEGLIHNLESTGDYQNALYLQKRLLFLRDSLYDVEKFKNVENINEKYQTEKKEKQLLIQENELAAKEMNIKSRNQWIAGLAILSVLVAIIGFLIYKDQRMRIQQQRKENSLKMEVQRVEAENLLQQQRLSISRDLHDNIGSQLTFVISSVDTLKHFLGNKDEKVAGRLSMVSDFVKETIIELRDTVWAMNHHHIGITDLKIRIANFMEHATSSVSNIRFTFQEDIHDNLKPAYDSKTGMNIYRIIQEAVNNAVKHSKATEILVKITASDQQIIFEVSDNGIGFNLAEEFTSNGLSSMEKRANEIEADFQLSSDENGTKLVFSLNQTPNISNT